MTTPRDSRRLDFLQDQLSGKVVIASADKEAVITFHAEGGDLRAAIDSAMKSAKSGEGRK